MDEVEGWDLTYRHPETGELSGVPNADWIRLFSVRCPTYGGIRWVPPAAQIDAAVLVDAALSAMYTQIPEPTLNISPAADVGTVVNLGLWLAVEDPGGAWAVAESGSVWAETTATMTGTSWDFGNGDVVSCDGLGAPYPAGSNQIEQGPCGYTYTEQPPPDGYIVTATGHWEVRVRTSRGVDAFVDPIEMQISFPYDVNEIITVGV